ncbi:MAG: hypothetical protein MJ185_02630 [Treponema sp.]|nr:hypothetical protein [Treponema sp.]
MEIFFSDNQKFKNIPLDFLLSCSHDKKPHESPNIYDFMKTQIQVIFPENPDLLKNSNNPKCNIKLSLKKDTLSLLNSEIHALSVIDTISFLFSKSHKNNFTIAIPISIYNNSFYDTYFISKFINKGIDFFKFSKFDIKVYFYGTKENINSTMNCFKTINSLPTPDTVIINKIENIIDKAKKLSLNEFIKEFKNDSAYDLLNKYIKEKEKKTSGVYKQAGISKQDYSNRFGNYSKQPEKILQRKYQTISISIVLNLELNESVSFLASYGYAFSNSEEKDLIIQYYICNHKFDIFNINNELEKRGLPPLGNSIL